MAPKTRPKAYATSPAQLATLRPISADPIRNREHGLTRGLHGPLSTHKPCKAVARSTGNPCRNPAAYGTDRCLSHLKRTGDFPDRAKASDKTARNRDTTAARLWLEAQEVPVALTREAAWIEADGGYPGQAYLRKRALLVAYTCAMETGDWTAWRTITI